MDQGFGSTIISINGQPKEIAVALSFSDIDVNGVAWCEPVRGLIEDPKEAVRLLGSLVVISAICRESGRLEDALGALYMARRMTTKAIRSIEESIASLLVTVAPTLPVSKTYEIVPYHSDQERFLSCLRARSTFDSIYHPGLPYGGLLGIGGYRREDTGDKPIDNLSFLVLNKGRTVATVPLLVYADHVGSWVRWIEGMPGIPAEIFYENGALEFREVANAITRHLIWLARRYAIREFLFQEVPGSNGSIARSLGRHYRYSAEIWERPIVDLTLTVGDLFKKVRKSYKSSINWGMKTCRMEYLSGSKIDRNEIARVYSLFRECQVEMYRKYGDSFSRALFDEAIHMCSRNAGEIAISYSLENGVCGVVISSDAGGISYYALGASKIVEGHRSPSHWLVFDAVQRAKKRGNREYHLGRLFGAPITASEYSTRKMSKRELDLLFFKRGFSENSEVRHVFRFVTDAIS